MEDKVKELLINNNEDKKVIALSLLFLKYKMVCDKNDDVDRIEYLSYFCVDRCYKQEIENLEKHFSIKIDVENSFIHEVIKTLEYDNLIAISTYDNNKDSLKITVPNGIEYLRKIYSEKYSENEIDNDEKLSSTIVYNIVNNINIHIGDVINNITQGMSSEDKNEFIKILKEYSKEKDKTSFLNKLGNFSKKVGEDIFISTVANLFNPSNLATILNFIF